MKKYKNIIILIAALFLYTNCEEKPDDTTLGFINEDTKVLLAGMLLFNSYSTNATSGTITDFTSGLMWKICTQGQVLRVGQNGQYDCEGINDSSTIIGRYGASLFQYCSLNLNDCNTISLPPVLVGQTPGFSGTSEAYNSCSQDRTAQHSDWRLPTFPELKALTGSGSLNALLLKFPNTVEDYYWTSWAQEGTVDTARAVNFEATHFGENTSFTKTSRYFVRCVRNFP
ncbi:PF07603 family protein [Leptospira santarosai str. CBC379]|uniref:PF07603 family protein n=1 Tax=Leptospira santarosai str. MOR084 TaxID=1049984 RepID=A0A0E2BHT6_9LEPT|nr:DUF1566 domain-containing protein [Leptospira santarosai]EKO34734.1 PF07603 family protein [Leptospira santarosai str. MOR084]EKR93208.1 PF07603 family protein [Leptospira santarosai str. CBC379]